MKLALAFALFVVFVSLEEAHGWYYGYSPYYSGYGYGYNNYGYSNYYGGYRPYSYYSGYYPSSYYGYSYWGKRAAAYKRAVDPTVPVVPIVKPECVYHTADQILQCQGGSWILQCPTELSLNWNSSVKFEFFAIQPNQNVSSNDQVVFNLYPRFADNAFWLNHTIWLDEHFVSFHLYSSEVPHENVYGFRVLDWQCFQDLITLFSRSTYDYVVNLHANDVFKFDEWNITAIGDILISP